MPAWLGLQESWARLASLDLRFERPENEAGYVASREKLTLRYLLCDSAVALAVLPLVVAPVIAGEVQRPDGHLALSANDPRTFYFGILIALALCSIVAFLYAGLSLLVGPSPAGTARSCWFSNELLVFWYHILETIAIALGVRSWNAAALAPSGVRMEVWAHDMRTTETSTLLILATLTMTACTVMPARIHYLGVVALSAPVSYLVVSLAFGAPDALLLPQVIPALTALSLFAIVGAWTNERCARKEWTQVAEVKATSAMAAALQAIAERCCDVVVDVAPDLSVCRCSPSHEAFFGRPVVGEPFTVVLAASDRARLVAMLARSSATGIVQPFPANLLCRSGRGPAELLVVDTGLPEMRFVIGVRADALRSSVVGSGLFSPSFSSAPVGPPAGHVEDRLGQRGFGFPPTTSMISAPHTMSALSGSVIVSTQGLSLVSLDTVRAGDDLPFHRGEPPDAGPGVRAPSLASGVSPLPESSAPIHAGRISLVSGVSLLPPLEGSAPIHHAGRPRSMAERWARRTGVAWEPPPALPDRMQPMDTEPDVDGHEEVIAPAPPVETFTDPYSEGNSSSGQVFANLQLEQMRDLGRSEHWLIDASHLRLPRPARQLGAGSFGKVITAKLYGRAVAVKIPREREDGSRAHALANELRVLRHLRHTNLVLFHGAIISPSNGELALVYEFVRGVRLDEFLERPPPSPAPLDRHCVVLDVCCALQYLHAHQPPILHGDLKAGNVMVENLLVGPRAKLIDFGLSRIMTRNTKPLGGTQAWAALELFQQDRGRPAPSADVFSYGWLVYYTMTGVTPYGGRRAQELIEAIKVVLQSRRMEALNMPPDAPFREQCRKLCEACLTLEPQHRPDMRAIHTKLLGWISVDDVCRLGFDVATAVLPDVMWRDGVDSDPTATCKVRSMRSEDEAQTQVSLRQQEMQVDIRSTGSTVFRIDFVTGGPICGMGHSKIGANFCDWLQDPDTLKIWLCAILNDIQRGAAGVPLICDFDEVPIHNPDNRLQGTKVAIKVFFPDSSGRISLRLFPTGSERHLPDSPPRPLQASVPLEASDIGTAVAI